MTPSAREMTPLPAGGIPVPQGGTLGGGSPPPDAANVRQGLGCPSVSSTKGEDYVKHPRTSEWARGSRPGHLYKQSIGEGPPGDRFGGQTAGGGLRRLAAEVRWRLRTVEKNPGPGVRRGRRRVCEARREARRRGRHAGRRERGRRRNAQGKGRGGMVREVVTWNLQRVSLREVNRCRLRRVVAYVEKKGWEMVLLTELSDDGEGVLWLGEGEQQVAIVHGCRAGILLRGDALELWKREGEQKWLYDRVAAVVLGKLRLVSVYQPVWGANEEAMERCRRDMESQVGLGRRERLIIGGDFNANVGKGNERGGVCGRYGLGRMNEAGRDLIEWCEEHEMAYANSFVRHKRRGTWFNRMYGRWYELDGFVVRKGERHRMVRRIRTVEEMSLSDHKPKSIKIAVSERKWRAIGGDRRRKRIKWELLRDEGKKREYKEETRRRMELLMEGEEEESKNWDALTEVMVESARKVCGEMGGRVDNPWMIGHEAEVEEMRREISEVVTERNRKVERMKAMGRLRERQRQERMRITRQELEEVKERLREVRRRMRVFLRRLEREWWEERIRECEEACNRGRVGEMYAILKEVGKRSWKRAPVSCKISVEEFKEHFEGVTAERYELEPERIREAVEGACDLRQIEKAREANVMMNEEVSREEVIDAMNEMKDSAPGEDAVRMRYIREACEDVKEEVIEKVQFMFENRADRWDASLKVGLMCALFKKGDRLEKKNYRGVCLLAMGSRVLARILSKRLRWWAEHMELLDENQCGFRCGRSTADVAQIVVRMNEDVCDYRKRGESRGVDVAEEEERPVARLLDLEKAYPRVNKPALWMLLERYGLRGKLLETVMDLHETTEYKVKGWGGVSESWTPARGLREGCSTSPILFNIYHQAVMRQAGEAREVVGGGQVGVEWKWIPGSSFAGGKSWESGSSEAKSVRIRELLFADDTTLVGEHVEMERGVEEVKEVMRSYEERNNEAKEEHMEFGSEEANEVRMLGSWVGAEADGRMRIRRASGLWAKVKGGLIGTRLSKRWQARIVEACVESGLLFDCQVRVWWKKDVKSMQKWTDKCYRYVWSDRNGQPLRQMQARGENMQDVRNRLGVKSVQWKIEKRVLERIGHVMRMGNDRLTKAVVLGWYGKLEGTEKVKGKKRKTVLYWRRLLREAGIDCTDVERLTRDRAVWKKLVGERMSHLEKWERQRGHKYDWADGEVTLERNVGMGVEERGFVCRYEGCLRVCKSKAGRTAHERRMHRVVEERVRFDCGSCGMRLETAGAKRNHERSCTGGRATEGQRECGGCGLWISRGNYARHVRTCGAAQGGGERERGGRARGGRGVRRQCDRCGRWQSATNMARHQRDACRVWDPGGGPDP